MAKHDSSPKKKVAGRPHDGAATAKSKKASGRRGVPRSGRRSSEVAKTVVFGVSAAASALAPPTASASAPPMAGKRKPVQKTVVFGVGTLGAPEATPAKASGVKRTMMLGVVKPEGEVPASTGSFRKAQERALVARRRQRTGTTGVVGESLSRRVVAPEELGDDAG